MCLLLFHYQRNNSNGFQPNSDGLPPNSDGLQPNSDGLRNIPYVFLLTTDHMFLLLLFRKVTDTHRVLASAPLKKFIFHLQLATGG